MRPHHGHRLLSRVRVAARRFRRTRTRVELFLARKFGLATREDRFFFVLVPLVGVAAGLLGFLVTRAISGIQFLLWRNPRSIIEAAGHAPPWLHIAAPVAGGLVVALIIWRGRQRVAGHGVSGIVEAVAFRGGEIRPRPVLLRLVAAIVTVGSGGSLGREGPAIRTSSMIASWSGLKLRMSSRRVRILVGCGAAAGMAAIYNTPIGGALFVMEVILGSFALEVFGPLVVASVIATLVGRALLGPRPLYQAAGYHMASLWDLVACVGLGVIGALLSVAFTTGLRLFETIFDRMKPVPAAVKPVIGMALLGGIGLYAPYVFGNGFDTITLALHEKLDLKWLLLLPPAKLVASGITMGSGCSGGLFTPSLFFGALAGGAYGEFIHGAFPTVTASSGAYAAVGMAAIAAGVSHAPISAIVMLFEITGNYDLILPLMTAAILSSLLSRRLYPHSIYLEPIARRGLKIPGRSPELTLAATPVRSLMRRDDELLHPTDNFRAVVDRFLNTRRQRLFVIDAEGVLLGAISLHDIKHVLDNPDALQAVVAHDLMAPVPITAREDDRLDRATELFAGSDTERIPVIDGRGRFRGLLSKRDLLTVFAQEVVGRPAVMTTFAVEPDAEGLSERVELPPDYAVARISLPAALAGQTLAQAALPERCGIRIIEISRPSGDHRSALIPGAATVFEPGDELLVLGSKEGVEKFRRGETGPGGSGG